MDRGKLSATVTKLSSVLRNVVAPQIEALEQQISASLAAKAAMANQLEEREEEFLQTDRTLRQKVDGLESEKRTLQKTLLLRQQECASMSEKLTQFEKQSKTLVVAYRDVDGKLKKYKGLSDQVVAMLGMNAEANPAEVLEMLKRRLQK
eukprot:TRINITY_DN17052_c0_g1_i1.p1 TRINITY_DN17052_c0_g1~~TRINITY_DN17052_c0_g1_i1.p1  ORF type:complete len:149 (+),score=29.01 TRINITY_DN17052_c0_g1_i1:140-586(+)